MERNSMGQRYGRHPSNALTNLKVRQIKEPGFYADGQGLHLKVDLTGAKRWVARLTIKGTGKRRDYGLGGYPLITLAMAREKVLEYRRLTRQGIDPGHEQRKALADRRMAIEAKTERTFEKIARAKHESLKGEWDNEKHSKQWISTLEVFAFPVFGNVPVDEIDTAMVMKVLEPIWMTKTTTASRLRGRIEQVLDAAKVAGLRSGDNPARWRGHLEHLLAKPHKVIKTKHLDAVVGTA